MIGQQTERPIDRLAVIGVGLIGGSLVRALRQQGACEQVIGCGRSRATLHRAAELGLLDDYETDPARAVRGAEVVVVAVPLGSMESVFRELREAVQGGVVVTDVGSAKCAVVSAARAAFGRLPPSFVPGHPIAGAEKSGVEASSAALYRNRRVILTPSSATAPAAIARIRWMWQQVGAEVLEMDCGHHDALLADTSHLPHLLAYTLVDGLARKGDPRETFRCAGGGFRDFTRIAASDPYIWRDICLANRDALLASVRLFVSDLERISEAIRARDGDTLLSVFGRAKEARDRLEEP